MRTKNVIETEERFLQDYQIIQVHTSFLIYSTAIMLVTLISSN